MRVQPSEVKLNWVEYKILRQYRSMGEVLDEFKAYGFSEGMDNILSGDMFNSAGNGHAWLTVEPGEEPEGGRFGP